MIRIFGLLWSLSLIAGCSSHSPTASSDAPSPANHACQTLRITQRGTTYQIEFAKNGAVQRYLVVRGSQNVEADHDGLKDLIATYGPEAVNAPAITVTKFHRGPGGMIVPEQAIDSCGRVIRFH